MTFVVKAECYTRMYHTAIYFQVPEPVQPAKKRPAPRVPSYQEERKKRPAPAPPNPFSSPSDMGNLYEKVSKHVGYCMHRTLICWKKRV